jgi:ABC-2 type transport system permease protein
MVIRRYAKIYKTMLKYALIKSTQYKANFLLEIGVEIGYQATLILFFSILYGNIKEIAGWTYYEVLFLLGLNIIISEWYLALTQIYNLKELPQKIKDGEIDFILLKPMSSLFNLTLSTPYFTSFIASVAGIYLIVKSVPNLNYTISPMNVLAGLITCISGLIIAYSISVLLTSLAFKFANAERFPQIAQGIIFGYGNNPPEVYQGILKPIFYFLIPVVFIVGIPAETFIREIQWQYVLLSVTLAALFLYVTVRVWNIMIRYYSSASS